MTPIHDWGDAFKTSVANALSLFLGAIPKVIAFAIILIVGWLIAAAVAKVIAALLHRVKFNDMAERAGLSKFTKDMGLDADASSILAGLVKWFIRLIALVTAFDALGLPAVSAVLQRFLLFLPNVVVALVIIVLGGLAAQALAKLVRGIAKDASLGNPDLLAKLTSITVWAFAIIIAINQVGIASSLVNILFIGFVGALALALGLAFGLGGRETAGQLVQSWYQHGQEAAPKLAEAANSAAQRAQTSTTATDGMRPDAEAYVQVPGPAR